MRKGTEKKRGASRLRRPFEFINSEKESCSREEFSIKKNRQWGGLPLCFGVQRKIAVMVAKVKSAAGRRPEEPLYVSYPAVLGSPDPGK